MFSLSTARERLVCEDARIALSHLVLRQMHTMFQNGICITHKRYSSEFTDTRSPEVDKEKIDTRPPPITHSINRAILGRDHTVLLLEWPAFC